MVRSSRLTIAGLMGAVLVASLGLTALQSGSGTWAGVVSLLACGVLALALVGVACGGETERAWWLGFAVWGCGYTSLAFWSHENALPTLPTEALLDVLRPYVGPAAGWMPCLLALLAAGLGGLLAPLVYDPRDGAAEREVSATPVG